MLNLESCPRCKGNLLFDRDDDGWYQQCLQCGYLRDLEDVVAKRGWLVGQETKAAGLQYAGSSLPAK